MTTRIFPHVCICLVGAALLGMLGGIGAALAFTAGYTVGAVASCIETVF